LRNRPEVLWRRLAIFSRAAAPPVAFPWQIQDGYGYKHGSYLPPTDPALFSQRVTDFVRRAFHGQPQPRPGALD